MASSASGAGLWRRPAGTTGPLPPPPSAGDLRPDVDPPPRPPRLFFQFLALGLIVVFAGLQLLPATHFRDPSDPRRVWIAFDSNRTVMTDSRASGVERIHVYSWMSCLDLRQLAVLANSTLSNSRFRENVSFHFIVPEGEDKKVAYYKLKVILPNSEIDIIQQKVIIEKLRTLVHEGEILWPSLHEVVPLIIPTIDSSLNRFIYVSPDTIVKGNIEELFGVDLGPHAIAAAEDCTRRLGDYVNINVLNAIQRTAAKSWVSKEPYDRSTCMLDFNVLLLDTKKLEKNSIEAILWWSKVLDLKSERSNEIKLAITLALYNRRLKLSSAWKRCDSSLLNMNDVIKVLRFDGPRRDCSEHKNQDEASVFGNVWQQYLLPKSDAILSH